MGTRSPPFRPRSTDSRDIFRASPDNTSGGTVRTCLDDPENLGWGLLVLGAPAPYPLGHYKNHRAGTATSPGEMSGFSRDHRKPAEALPASRRGGRACR